RRGVGPSLESVISSLLSPEATPEEHPLKSIRITRLHVDVAYIVFGDTPILASTFAGERRRPTASAAPQRRIPAIVSKLPLKPPVASRAYPIRYGPTNPPRLPSELMSAIAPAAAVPLKNAV